MQRLRSEGYGFEAIAERVPQVINLPLELVLEKSRRTQVVQDCSPLYYRAGSEFGMSMQEIANRLGLRQPAVSIATRWGKKWQGRKSIFVWENSYLYIYGRPSYLLPPSALHLFALYPFLF